MVRDRAMLLFIHRGFGLASILPKTMVLSEQLQLERLHGQRQVHVTYTVNRRHVHIHVLVHMHVANHDSKCPGVIATGFSQKCGHAARDQLPRLPVLWKSAPEKSLPAAREIYPEVSSLLSHLAKCFAATHLIQFMN